MNKHLKKIIWYIKEIFTQLALWYKEQSRINQLIIAVILIVISFLIGKFGFSQGVDDTTAQSFNRSVTVSSVSSLSNREGDFSLVGTVTSVSEATIRSESSGRLTRVYKKLGDTVLAGGTIAEFENSGERASVLQAEGAYEQAKAARDIAQLNGGQAGTSLTDTKSQALNTISSAYATMDDAVRGKTDMAFSDPKFEQAKLLLSVPDANLVINIETKRKAIEKTLRAREAKNKTLTKSSDLLKELTVTQNEVDMIKTYLDDLYTAYSKALPDTAFNQATLESGRGNVQSARQAILGISSSLVGSRTALSASITANEIAGSGFTEVSGTLATAEAQVKQALGAYNASLSRLEKTIIRSPITGTLNSLTINTGDFVTAFSQVAVVSNNGVLEIISSVTGEDSKRITVNTPAVINGTIEGVVTRIASGIDPTTNKIEIRIGIKDTRTSLINGQSVRIVLKKNTKDVVTTVNTPLIIPLSALKLTPRGANVFEVNASGTLTSIPVKEGAIMGEQIQILEGLQGSEEIVVDARGLKEGMKVDVTQ